MNIVLLLLDVITIIIGLILTIKSIKHIIRGNYSMLDVCVILFFVMQILPIAVGYFGNLQKIEKYYKYVYYAMTDINVGLLYDCFSIFSISFLYFFSKKFANEKIKDRFKINSSKIVAILLFAFAVMSIFSLLIGVLLAPDINVYTTFSYFYTHDYSTTSEIYIYHSNVISTLCRVSLFSILLSYYFSNSKNKTFFAIPIALLTWVNGKRTLFIFALLGILIIDFLKSGNERKKMVKLLKKAIVFLIIIIIYYVLYNSITQKSSFADNYLLYTVYFSRLCNVKVAIYDLLYTNTMISYPFENVIYDLLFFVPRSIWAMKPYGYYQHFTSYAFYGVGNLRVPNSAFQVNIWSEFITNGGVLGVILSLMLVIFIIKKCELSKNNLIYLSGTIFVLLYMAYGFEHIVQIIFVIYLLIVFFTFLKKRLRR